MASRGRRSRILIATAVVAVLALPLGAAWLMQDRLIYFPTQWLPPLDALVPGWEEVTLTTEDDLELGAWYRAPEGEAPVVIVFNGNAGNRGDRLRLGAALAERGLGVLLTDYRGYGGNPGRPSEAGLALDAGAARRIVEDLAPGRPVAYFGESLGAAVAVELALEYPPDALVLRSPFASLDEVARHHYPFLPVGLLLRDRYPSIERIGAIEVPVLVIAGSADTIVPVEQSRNLFARAANPVRLLVLEGADHNDAELTDGPEVIGAVAEILGMG